MVPKMNKSSWITLNVGGRNFLTTKHTLLSTPSIFRQLIVDEPTEKVPMYTISYWRQILKSRKKKKPNLDMKAYHQLRMKEDNLYYIDRDPQYFAPVLNFMRYKRLIRNYSVSLQGIMEEANYFQVTELVEYLEDHLGVVKPALPEAVPLYEEVLPEMEEGATENMNSQEEEGEVVINIEQIDEKQNEKYVQSVKSNVESEKNADHDQIDTTLDDNSTTVVVSVAGNDDVNNGDKKNESKNGNNDGDIGGDKENAVNGIVDNQIREKKE